MATTHFIADHHALRARLARLRDAGPAATLGAVYRRLNHQYEAYGLRRDLDVPFPAPEARLPVRVRELVDGDVGRLLDPHAPGLEDADRHERRARLALLHSGLRTPYVAVDDADRPAYVQWLIGPEQNDLLAHHFGGTFPRLRPDEALLEGAYTSVDFRGQRVMPRAMALIAERAAELGARYVLTFVTTDNGASLTGCSRAGFAPYTTRTVVDRNFRRRIAFADLPQQPTGR